jgi:hypothetical protein
MAKRRITEKLGKDWELKGYAWRGDCEKSALTGKQIRPVVAVDSEGKFHSGVRNGEHDGKRRGTLYWPQATPDRIDAVALAQWMWKQCVAQHRDLANDIGRDRNMRASASERYGAPDCPEGKRDIQQEIPTKLSR